MPQTQELFLEISPGYMIPLRAIQAVQWKDDALRIAYDKAGTSTTVEIKDVRGAARYLYEQLRNHALTYETGPEFEPDEELG